MERSRSFSAISMLSNDHLKKVNAMIRVNDYYLLKIQSTLVIADTFETSFCVRSIAEVRSNLYRRGSEFFP